jgi:hypothetical protein
MVNDVVGQSLVALRVMEKSCWWDFESVGLLVVRWMRILGGSAVS